MRGNPAKTVVKVQQPSFILTYKNDCLCVKAGKSKTEVQNYKHTSTLCSIGLDQLRYF